MCSSMSNDINLNKIQSLIPPSTLKTQLPHTTPIPAFSVLLDLVPFIMWKKLWNMEKPLKKLPKR